VVLPLLFLAFFALGWAFPTTWWGTHAWTFLPRPVPELLGLTAALLAASTLWDGRLLQWLQSTRAGRPWPAWLTLAVPLALATLAYSFPIEHDPWGDGPNFKEAFDGANKLTRSQRWDLVLSRDVFHPRVGVRTVLNAVALMPVDYQQGFQTLGAACMAAWALMWLLFVQASVADALTARLLALCGLTAPWLAWFFGHLEIYGPGYVAVGAFCMVAHRFVATQRTGWLWVLPLCWLAVIKMHISGFLLAPTLLLCVVYGLRPDLITWRRVAIGVILPYVILGCMVYFGTAGDHVDSRLLSDHRDSLQRLFLPLAIPEPPLDRYWLFASGHLSDFVNLLLVWSAPALLLALVAARERAIRWADPAIIVGSVTLFAFTTFFFVVNPLLGPELDQDLLSLPGPALLVWVVALAAAAPVRWSFVPRLAGPVVALCLLAVPTAAVNAHPPSLGKRLDRIGVGAFQRYWIGSARTLETGMRIGGLDEGQRLARYQHLLDELKPWAVEGADREYAHLAWRLGRYYRRKGGDRALALQYHQHAFEYAPGYPANLVGLLEAQYLNGLMTEAHATARRLVAIAHPSPQQAARMAIHMALEAEAAEAARGYCLQYLRFWPKDHLIADVLDGLIVGTPTLEIARVFSRPR
jgi:hypothetical protein